MYTNEVEESLKEKNIKLGDRVSIVSRGKRYEGLLMPRTGESDVLVLKLDNGYNIGLKAELIEKSIGETPSAIKEQESVLSGKYHSHLKQKKENPKITILSTGGTIASRIDYRTGGVTPTFTAEEIVTMVPEIAEMANIKGRLIKNVSSEDMRFSDYSEISLAIKEEIGGGADGIIITHGTDTLHYTSAALSFSLEELPIPVLLVGSQRSSDRGSSDGPFNLICAAKFITETDFSGVAICMHASSSDIACSIIEGTKARKMHTSRRDAFQPVNSKPIALVGPDFIEFQKDYRKRDPSRKISVKPHFDDKVSLVKTFVGMNPENFESSIKGMKGIVVEGTGLGHVPENILAPLKRYISEGGIAVLSSQCVNGRVNMNVYSRGRDLLEMGVLSSEDMTAETSLIKLSWILGNNMEKDSFSKNLRGEISDRII